MPTPTSLDLDTDDADDASIYGPIDPHGNNSDIVAYRNREIGGSRTYAFDILVIYAYAKQP